MYPPYWTDKEIKSFLNNKFWNNDTSKDNFNKKKNSSYYKLPYIGDIFVSTKEKIGELYKRFRKTRTSILFFLHSK